MQKTPYKGTTVTRLGPKEIREIFQLRVELESLAVDWAKQNVTPVDIKELHGLIKNMEESAEELNLDQFYQNDLMFHRKLWLLSGNSYLADVLERMVVPLFAFFVMKTRREHESYVESAAMHRKIVEDLETKSSVQVRERMRKSLMAWTDDMLKLLFSQH